VNIEKKADESTESSMNEKDEIVDTDSSPERLQFIPTDDLIGRDLFLDEEETGEHKRARILKICNEHVEKGRELPDLVKVRLKVDEDEFDDLIAYNETLDFMQPHFEVTDGVDTLHGVKNMLDLCGQSSARKEDPTNRMKTYDGSPGTS
jgi:hypothetical protein